MKQTFYFGICLFISKFLIAEVSHPPLPINLTASSITSSSINYSWASGGGTTSGFIVKQSVGDIPLLSCEGGKDVKKDLARAFSSLASTTTYTFAVCAYNSEKVLSASTVIKTTTLAPPPPKPGKPTIANITASSFDVRWTSGAGSTSGFVVKKVLGKNSNLTCAGGVDVGNVLSYTLTNLVSSSLYTVAVCARSASGSISAPVLANATTLLANPPAPLALALKSRTSSNITVQWSSGGGTTAGFIVKAVVGNNPSLTCTGGSNVKTTMTASYSNLAPNGNYTVAVCAYNSAKVESPSVVLLATTYQVASPAPVTFTVGTKTDTSITLQWLNPGGTTTGFFLNKAVGVNSTLTCSGGEDVGNVLTSTVSSLTPNTTYTFALCSYNVNKLPSNSIRLTAITLIPAPPSPASLEVTKKNSSELGFQWASSGGTTSGFIVNLLPGGVATCTGGVNVGTALTNNFNFLLPNTPYTVAVCAYNSAGVRSAPITLSETTLPLNFEVTQPSHPSVASTLNSNYEQRNSALFGSMGDLIPYLNSLLDLFGGYNAIIQSLMQPFLNVLAQAQTTILSLLNNYLGSPTSIELPSDSSGYNSCVSSGYSISQCQSATTYDTSGYDACLNAGYPPSSCNPNGGSAYATCISRGYSPSSCSGAVPTTPSRPVDSSGYNTCLNSGYSPSSCQLGNTVDTSGYSACIARGYSPSSCNPQGGASYASCINAGYSPSSCNSAVPENSYNSTTSSGCVASGYKPWVCDLGTSADSSGYTACINAGYSPSSCQQGTSSDTSGYATCIRAGYSPSSCNPNGGSAYATCISRGYSPSSCSGAVPTTQVATTNGTSWTNTTPDSTGYNRCISAGYSPSSCQMGTSTDTSGYSACIQRGYSPSSCNPNGGSAYASCINAGYSPSSCSTAVPATSTSNGVTYVPVADSTGYNTCIRAGYSPSSCQMGTSTDTSGYSACISAGYSPSSCNPNGGSAYASCIAAGYSPSSCN